MQLILDMVEGSKADIGIYQGRISRMGMLIGVPLGFVISNPSAIVAGLAASGMPQKGDKFPDPDYPDYYCKYHSFRGLGAKGVVGVEIVYEYLGLLTIKDTTTLSSDMRQIHPNGQAMYVTWKDPSDASNVITKVATMPCLLPMRHITISQTVAYVASDDVVNALPAVNSDNFMGYGPGYWLYSGLEAETVDAGITRTYTVTLSTKVFEDWSTYAWLQNDNGQNIYVDPTNVSLMRNEPYIYGVNDGAGSVTNPATGWGILQNIGLIKVGFYPMVDFSSLFGIS